MTQETSGLTQNRRKRILLVEDSKIDAGLFRVALARIAPYVDLIIKTSVQDAVDCISQTDKVADLILLDLSLEDGTGFEILQALRNSPVNHVIPTVILSGSDREEDIRLSYAHGANSYVWKPMDIEDWISMLETLCTYWFGTVRLP